MKLYLITADIDGTTHSVWAGSQTESAAGRKAMLAKGATRKDTSTFTVEVPTGKSDLIEFLNDYDHGPKHLVAIRKLTAD